MTRRGAPVFNMTSLVGNQPVIFFFPGQKSICTVAENQQRRVKGDLFMSCPHILIVSFTLLACFTGFTGPYTPKPIRFFVLNGARAICRAAEQNAKLSTAHRG